MLSALTLEDVCILDGHMTHPRLGSVTQLLSHGKLLPPGPRLERTGDEGCLSRGLRSVTYTPRGTQSTAWGTMLGSTRDESRCNTWCPEPFPG